LEKGPTSLDPNLPQYDLLNRPGVVFLNADCNEQVLSPPFWKNIWCRFVISFSKKKRQLRRNPSSSKKMTLLSRKLLLN